MDEDGLGDLGPHGVHGVQGGHGVLEDHGHVHAPHPLQLLPAHAQDISAVDVDLAAFDDAGGIGHQVEDAHSGGGLAGAGLAHKAQGALPAQGEADAVDGVDDAVLGLVVHHQVLDPEDVALLGGGALGYVAAHIGSSYFFSFGSMESRRASPTRFRETTVSMIARPGNRVI